MLCRRLWLALLSLLSPVIVVIAEHPVVCRPPSRVTTEHYELLMRWSERDEKYGDYKLTLRLIRRGDGKELIQHEGRALGLANILFNGTPSRVYECRYGTTEYVMVALESYLGWRSTLIVFPLEGEGQNVTCRPRMITIFFESLCVSNGRLAYCGGWDTPETDKVSPSPKAISAEVRDLSLDRILWSGGLKDKFGGSVYRAEDDDSPDDKAYWPYRLALSEALCSKLRELDTGSTTTSTQ